MNNRIDIIVEGEGKLTLTQQHYKASGGEGVVYQKGSTAYKILHDSKRIMPRKKLEELNQIKADNVLIPQKYILDKSNNPIGFTMRYIQDNEFLCKLFNNGFRDKAGITHKDIIDLVKNMQLTLNKIHEANCLVVDFNQMNFLVDNKKYVTPYFIDTDSYQTPTFPATAIMECIRDRSVPRGKFSIFSDWFSFGIVSFWLYIGVHPYRGKHPDYSNNDWCGKRMNDNISLFNKDASMPACCQDLSVIPKPHLEWFKQIFTSNKRSVPPLPDGNIIVAVVVKIKTSAKFITSTIQKYNNTIRKIIFTNNSRYVITSNEIYKDSIIVYRFNEKYENIGFSSLENTEPLFSTFKDNKITIIDWKTNQTLAEGYADDFMNFNGNTYVRINNDLVKYTCTTIFDKTIVSVKVIMQVFGNSCKMYDGVIIQDILGKCLLTIPDNDGDFMNVEVKELNNKRIIDAKIIKNVCVVITEEKGNFFRYVISFSAHRSNYIFRKSEVENSDCCDFIIKNDGKCIAPIADDELEIWIGDKNNIIKNSPIPTGALMHTENNDTLFAVGNKLLTLKTK